MVSTFHATVGVTDILVVRTNGSATLLDDYLAGPTAPTAQTFPQQSVVVANCSLATGANQGYGSMTYDGQFGFFTCGVTTTTTRNIARVSVNGTCGGGAGAG